RGARLADRRRGVAGGNDRLHGEEAAKLPPPALTPARCLRTAIMPVTASLIDDTLLIVMDRPPVNALDLDMIAALEHVFADAVQKAPKNGVVLTGGGQVFSAGVDVRAFAAYSRDQRHAMVRAITRMVRQLIAIPRPVVSAVNGHAIGGGFVLM